MVLLCKSNKNSLIKEEIFENRFMHIPELNRDSKNLYNKNKALIEEN